MEAISYLEFEKKYFFTRNEVRQFFESEQQISDFIHGLKVKARILKINRTKYYLIPIKAKSGSWSENDFIIADEICNGKDYFIGGWAAANYWRLTDQIPMQVDIYTTRRQGKYKIMNMRFVFHRSSKKKVSKGVKKDIEGHPFIIIAKEKSIQWLKKRR